MIFRVTQFEFDTLYNFTLDLCTRRAELRIEVSAFPISLARAQRPACEIGVFP